MQLFSADATIFFKNFNFFFTLKNEKTALKSCSESAPIFFQYCQLTQNQPKSHFCSIKMSPYICKFQILKVFLETFFSHSRSEQFWKQSTISNCFYLFNFFRSRICQFHGLMFRWSILQHDYCVDHLLLICLIYVSTALGYL